MTTEKPEDAFLQELEDTGFVHLVSSYRGMHAAIERKDALLRQALEQMRDFSAIDICATQHHKKADRHSSIAQCPVAERFRAVCFAITKELQ